MEPAMEKELEGALWKQKNIIKSMIDSIPDLIFYKDIDSRYLGCNKAFANDFIGLSEEEIVGKKDVDFVKDKALAEFFVLKDKEMFQSGESQSNEETIQLADGTFVDIETVKTPFRDQNGEIAGLIGVSRDITARKNLEKELFKKEKILAAVAMSIKELLHNRDYYKAISNCLGILGKATLVDRAYLYVNNYDEEGNGRFDIKEEWFSSDEYNSAPFAHKNIPFYEIKSIIDPLLEGEPYCGLVRDIESQSVRMYLTEMGIQSIAILPIFVDSLFWGFVGFDECKYEKKWNEAEFSTLSAFASSIEKVIERNKIEKELELTAATDPLTKLLNRREMLRLLEQEKVRVERNGRTFSIIAADIDYFKTINDLNGHGGGDYVLEKVSRLLRTSLRQQDFVARWGGEEFLILLPEATVEGAVVIAEKIRREVERHVFVFKNKHASITMTMGVAEYKKNENIDELISEADFELYRGKENGRNCVSSGFDYENEGI